jgi:hypothetical protein
MGTLDKMLHFADTYQRAGVSQNPYRRVSNRAA